MQALKWCLSIHGSSRPKPWSNIEPLEIGSRVPHSTGGAFEPIILYALLLIRARI